MSARPSFIQVESALIEYRYNESYRLSERFLKFDLQQLLQAAVVAISNEGARYCMSFLHLPAISLMTDSDCRHGSSQVQRGVEQ